jgi:hypothetical protein
MAIKWPDFSNATKPENSVGDALRIMCDREIAQSAANMRQLQQARAAEAKRQRQESLDAAKVLDTDLRRS